MARRRRLWILSALLVAGTIGGFAVHRRYTRKTLANFKTVVEGKVYRSGQPGPDHLRRWRAEHGIATVINLRGADEGREEYVREREACRELGIRLIDIEWSATRQPGPEAVEALVRAFDEAPLPVLLHCAEGVDRSGVASVLAAMKIGNVDYRTARKQMGSKYASLDDAPGVVGLLRQYEASCRDRGVDPGGWAEFSAWLRR